MAVGMPAFGFAPPQASSPFPYMAQVGAAALANPYVFQSGLAAMNAMNPFNAFGQAAALSSANAQAAYGPEAQVQTALINAQLQRALAPYGVESTYLSSALPAQASEFGNLSGNESANYQSRLAAQLQQELQGMQQQYGGTQTLANIENQLQQLGPTLQAGLQTSAMPGAFGLAGQGIQSNLATALANLNQQPSFELPQLLGQQGLTGQEMNALQGEATTALGQQGNLLNSAIGGNTTLGQTGLSANSALEQANLGAESGLAQTGMNNQLAGALAALNNTAQGQFLNTGTTAGLQQQIQNLKQQGGLQAQNLNYQGALNNLAAQQNAMNWLEQGGQQALGANLTGEQNTQQNTAGLLGQLEGQNYGAGLQSNALNAQNYGNLLAQQGNTLGGEIGAQAGVRNTGTDALSQAIQNLSGNQTTGGLGAINAQAALDQAAMNTGLGEQKLQMLGNVFGNLFSHLPQIGSGPYSMGGIPMGGPIPPPPTSITGLNHNGSVFQNEQLNEALPGISSPAVPSTPHPSVASAPTTPGALPSPASFLSGIPTFANPTNAAQQEGNLGMLAQYANQPLMEPVGGLSRASMMAPAYQANEPGVLSELSKIGPFSNSFTNPELTPIGTDFTNPYSGPSGQDVSLAGNFSAPHLNGASLALASPLETPSVSAPGGNWYAGLTQGVGSIPIPGLVQSHPIGAPQTPDMSGLIQGLVQGPQTAQGPFAQFAQQLAGTQAGGTNPWTGLANGAQPNFASGPQFQMPNMNYNYNFS